MQCRPREFSKMLSLRVNYCLTVWPLSLFQSGYQRNEHFDHLKVHFLISRHFYWNTTNKQQQDCSSVNSCKDLTKLWTFWGTKSLYFNSERVYTSPSSSSHLFLWFKKLFIFFFPFHFCNKIIICEPTENLWKPCKNSFLLLRFKRASGCAALTARTNITVEGRRVEALLHVCKTHTSDANSVCRNQENRFQKVELPKRETCVSLFVILVVQKSDSFQK